MLEQEKILWDHIQYLHSEIWGSYIWGIIIILYVRPFIQSLFMTVNILYLKLFFLCASKIVFMFTMATGYKFCLKQLKNFATEKLCSHSTIPLIVYAEPEIARIRTALSFFTYIPGILAEGKILTWKYKV